MMKLGNSSWSFHRTFEEKKLDMFSWIRKCKEDLGHDGVELLDTHFASRDESYLKKIKDLTAELKLEIYCLSICSNFGLSDKSKRQQQVEDLKKWIDAGCYLEVPVVRYFAGRAEDGDNEKAWPGMVEATKECLDYAASKGVVFALENHNHNGFIRTSKDVLRLFNEINSPQLKMCLDLGNFTDLYTSIEATAHLSAVVHAKILDLDKDGTEKKLDYERIMKILKKANYNGYLSIEYEGKEDELTAMPRASAYLRKLIKKYE
jgi:sugar phosphate isomerase/epimerase